MNYTKPAVEVLGDAERLIKGSKSSQGDNGDLTQKIGVLDCELDD